MLHSKHHHPPHIFRDNTIYFITARTINQKLYFNKNSKKSLWCLCLKAGLQKVNEESNHIKESALQGETIKNISLYAWVMLDNHYHLLLRVKKGKYLFKFMNYLNGKSSYKINKIDKTLGRKIWYQYWDYCIRSKQDFFKHFNYIHNNPIKHKKVRNIEELSNYKFSSFNSWIKKKGGENG